MVCCGEGQVDEFSILSDVGAEMVSLMAFQNMETGSLDCDHIAGIWAEVVEKLSNALVTIGIVAEGVDDPDLTEVYSCCESG